MARPVCRAVKWAVAAAVLLALPLAQGATTTDPQGDVAMRQFGEPVDQPAVDLIEVRGELADGVLALSIEVDGILPIEGDADPDRRFSYLFIVGRGANGTLFQDSHLAVVCSFHQGGLDLGCELTQGDATLRRTAASDRNVSVELRVTWDGPLRVGAMANEAVANGTAEDIVAQDFTDNAVANQQPPPADGPADAPSPTPWWKTPWILVVVIVLAAAVVWWMQRK